MGEFNLLSPYFNCDVCGLYDTQSVPHYSIPRCVGATSSGLDNDDATQLSRIMHLFYMESHSYWSDLVMKDNSMNWDPVKKILSRNLESSMQAPLTTHWWSISELLAIGVFSNFYAVYLKEWKICVNTTKTTETRNIIASNLVRMCKVKWIVPDMHYIPSKISDWWTTFGCNSCRVNKKSSSNME